MMTVPGPDGPADGRAAGCAVPLVECALLDPRPADEADQRPICGAVNIPLAELAQRAHELPPRSETVRVAGPPALAAEAAGWLQCSGRRAETAAVFSYESAGSSRPPGRLWQPNPLLAEVLPRLPVGAALDLACGTGRNAVYLASCGWSVTGVDVLPDALARARELAGRCAAAIVPIRWLQRELEADPRGFEGGFDLVTVFRYLHRPLLERVGAWLHPGGSILCEVFTTLHRARHGRPARPAHSVAPGELPGLLAGFTLQHYREGWRGDAHTAQVWAIWPGTGVPRQ